MQRIWVQLCSKNRHKVIILFMHKGKRGNWVFINIINGGLLALLTRFSFRVFNEGGSLLFWFHFYSTNNNQWSNISTMHNHMVEGWNLMYVPLMCEGFHLNEVYCKGFANSNSNLNLKGIHMPCFHCSPKQTWSNMKTDCIFRILEFF